MGSSSNFTGYSCCLEISSRRLGVWRGTYLLLGPISRKRWRRYQAGGGMRRFLCELGGVEVKEQGRVILDRAGWERKGHCAEFSKKTAVGSDRKKASRRRTKQAAQAEQRAESMLQRYMHHHACEHAGRVYSCIRTKTLS